MNYILVFSLIAILFVFIYTVIIIANRSKSIKYSYKKKDFFMTMAEHELFDILINVIGEKYYVFPQVHLLTFLDHRIKGQNYMAALAHINRKSVDFVLCDKEFIKPTLAIELDDKSHSKEQRRERDKVVEAILSEVNMPLLRIENHGNFDGIGIKEQINSLNSVNKVNI